METILNKITDQILLDEKGNFCHFDPENIKLIHRKPPIDILERLKEHFFYITEVKKGSPSKGIIRKSFDPVEISKLYEKSGASAISILTEKNFFYGKKTYLRDIRCVCSLPLLRKDFIIHPFQVVESYNLGADFILLIAACLPDEQLTQLYRMSRSLGMQVLLEVHNHGELKRVLRLKPDIIGINNRDLKTFKVDLNTSFQLKKSIPDNIFVISESGIQSGDHVKKLQMDGFSGILVGEFLMKHPDVGIGMKELMDG